MRNVLPLLLVLLAAMVATAGFIDGRKKGNDQLVLQHSTGLAGVQKYLPAGAHIGFVCTRNDAPTYAACRYVLAPVYLGYRVSLPTDTLLVVNERENGDSLMQQMVASHKLLWQNTYLGYNYYLIAKQ